jgi:hypothetical protein
MPRYLLIELDNNDSADRMRAQIDAAEANGRGMRVIAMFSKTAKLCVCEVRSTKSVRGSKLGWWLCPSCHKPKPGSPQTLTNMLDDEGCPSKYREIFLSLRWVWNKTKDRVVTARSVPENDWR